MNKEDLDVGNERKGNSFYDSGVVNIVYDKEGIGFIYKDNRYSKEEFLGIFSSGFDYVIDKNVPKDKHGEIENLILEHDAISSDFLDKYK